MSSLQVFQNVSVLAHRPVLLRMYNLCCHFSMFCYDMISFVLLLQIIHFLATLLGYFFF